MPTLSIRLPDDLHAKWTAHCAALDLPPSAVARQLIEQRVSDTPIPVKDDLSSSTREPKGTQKKVRVSVWLTESEREGIRLRTTLHGGTRAGWIINLVRAALTREPQLGDDEVEALAQSNYQLLAIGRNLNQISRRLNEGQTQQAVELALLDTLRDRIDEHTDVVTRFLRSNTERWVIR